MQMEIHNSRKPNKNCLVPRWVKKENLFRNKGPRGRIIINWLPKNSGETSFFVSGLVISEFSICVCNSPFWYHNYLSDSCASTRENKPLPFRPYSYSPHALHPTVIQGNEYLSPFVLPIHFLLSLPLSITCLWLFYFDFAVSHCWLIVVRCALLANICNEQHWNLTNIVLMVAELENMFWQPVLYPGSKTVFDPREKHFLIPKRQN